MSTTFPVTMVTSDTVVLPLELLEEIFDITASLSTQSCLALCLVSSWVHRRVIPSLMSQIVLTSFTATDSFYNQLFYTRRHVGTLVDPVSHIHDLWLPDDCPMPSNIFLACRNLRRAAIDIQTLEEMDAEKPEDREDDGDLDLSLRGQGRIRQFEHLMKAHYIMRRITHLHNVSIIPALLFDHLPRITHLAIPWNTGTSPIAAPLALALTTLKMLVFVVDTRSVLLIRGMAKDQTRMLRRNDGRVWFLETDKGKVREEWEDEGKGGESLWDRAIRQTTDWEKVNH